MRNKASRPGWYDRPKWHLLYFALAAFDVFAVCVGLYVTHTVVDIYSTSVRVNQEWADRALEFAQLGELAAAVNAPGNDVFETRDAKGEALRLQVALQRFRQAFTRVRRELQLEARPEEVSAILPELDAVGDAIEAMAGEARPIFAQFAVAPALAGGQMAAMDQRYAQVNAALDELRYAVSAVQARNFEAQMAAARTLERREALIAVLVLLMVGGATFYGRRMAQRARREAQEKEATLRDISAARSRLEIRSLQLELSNRLLRETQAQLQALLRRTLHGQEAHRRHIARELHEEVAQMLAGLKMRLAGLRLPPGVGEEVEPHVKHASTIAETALDRLRHLVRGLAPHGMESLGLSGILPVHLQEWTRGTGLTVSFAESVSEVRAPFPVEIAAYRVIEEAVANAALHAEAKHVRVTLFREAGVLRARIEDDGIGFDLRATRRDAERGEGMGIVLMEQRVALAGGRLQIETGRGKGTTVTATFPLALALPAPGARPSAEDEREERDEAEQREKRRGSDVHGAKRYAAQESLAE